VGNNRYRLSRERAGLSTGQAARLLGVTADELRAAERAEPSCTITTERLADLYGVAVEWLTGACALRDYAAIDRIPGGRELLFCDRNMLAELFASLPRRDQR
jgi:hypothetical protein